MFRRWRRRKSINKVKSGDGHALNPCRLKHLFSWSLLYASLCEDDGAVHTFAVNGNYFSEESTAELYRDGKHYISAIIICDRAYPHAAKSLVNRYGTHFCVNSKLFSLIYVSK